MKKLINFKDMSVAIKAYADANCEGNFSLAVRQLIRLKLEELSKEVKA